MNNGDFMQIEIKRTQLWLEQVIVGFNICPFAKKELVNNTIHYHLSSNRKVKFALEELIDQCCYLTDHSEVETSLLVYNEGFKRFEDYLDLVAYAEELMADSGFEGIFQLATFHPDYYFEGEDFNDAANFTNRSPYPTLHLIREESLTRVLSVYKNPEQIPVTNINLTRSKGAPFFSQILKNIQQTN